MNFMNVVSSVSPSKEMGGNTRQRKNLGIEPTTSGFDQLLLYQLNSGG